MTDDSLQIKIPGKLFVAGEYAVLEPNQQAIVVAVDRYITADVSPSQRNSIALPQLGFDLITWDKDKNNKIKFSKSDQRLRYIQQSIIVASQFLREKSIELHPIHIEISSNLYDSSGRKYGLGSSAAIVVAVITSILKVSARGMYQPKHKDIYKLSAIAHYRVQGNGSAADIAASTYGGWLCYSVFDAAWLLEELKQNTNIAQIIDKPWPRLMIKPITPPSKLYFCVGWTGEVARTGPMVNKIQKLKKTDPNSYQQFLKSSNSAVTKLVASFEKQDISGILASLKENRRALRLLGEQAGTLIETEKLKVLSDIADQFGAGKSSGAGGGDCGIALVTQKRDIPNLHKLWEEAGILPLDLKVSSIGAIVD